MNNDYFQIIQDRQHILPNLISGAKAGLISQFLSDIIVSILLYNQTIVINDIKISKTDAYASSIISGITASVLSIYLDPFALVLISSFAYEYTFNIVANYNNKSIKEFNVKDIIFDSIVSIILIYLFDPTAHNQYIRYKEKRYLLKPQHKRMNRSLAQTIFFIVLTNTYNFFTEDD